MYTLDSYTSFIPPVRTRFCRDMFSRLGKRLAFQKTGSVSILRFLFNFDMFILFEIQNDTSATNRQKFPVCSSNYHLVPRQLLNLVRQINFTTFHDFSDKYIWWPRTLPFHHCSKPVQSSKNRLYNTCYMRCGTDFWTVQLQFSGI